MKIVIQGAGEIGSHLAKMLSKEANDITIIDDNPQRLQNITAIADVIAIEGLSAFTGEEMHALAEAVRPIVPAVQVRGVD